MALVVAAILGGTLYFFDVRQLRANESGLDLLVASYIRETVPGLRTPQYFPAHVRGTTSKSNDIPFVASSACDDGKQNRSKLILNFVDGMDDRTRVGERTIKHRIIRDYR